MSFDTMIDKARALFRGFHGKEPTSSQVVAVRLPRSDAAAVIGEIEGIAYRALSDGKIYYHAFAKRARPVLAVSHDGSQFYALAGAYRFTDRGFEDRASKKGA